MTQVVACIIDSSWAALDQMMQSKALLDGESSPLKFSSNAQSQAVKDMTTFKIHMRPSGRTTKLLAE